METETKKLPYSVRKFIRLQKAKIHSQFLDYKKEQELISEMYKKAWATQEKQAAKKTAKTEAKPVEVKTEAVKPAAKKEAKKVEKKVKAKK